MSCGGKKLGDQLGGLYMAGIKIRNTWKVLDKDFYQKLFPYWIGRSEALDSKYSF